MNCETIQELLEAYALDALDIDEQEMVERHLDECDSCRQLANAYRETTALLPQAVANASPLHPPPVLKSRLLEQIAAQPRVVAMPSSPVLPSPQADQVEEHASPGRASIRPAGRWPDLIRWFNRIGAVAAALLLVLALAWIARLSTALSQEQVLRERLSDQTELIFEVVDSDVTTRLFLRPQPTAPVMENAAPPYGKVFIRADQPHIVAMTGRLAPPPPGKVYNLWLFDEDRSELAGVMVVDDKGFGSLVYNANRNGPNYDSARLILQDKNSQNPTGETILIWTTEAER